jgi:thiol-disulfide isomerase/thioredoxin
LLLGLPFALIAAVIVFLALDDGGGASPGSRIELDQTSSVPKSLREVSLVAGDGTATSLAEVLDGKPTVINFFGSWCPPCVEEMPAFERVHDAAGADVTFLGLAVRDRPEDAQAIVKRTGVTFRTLRDADGDALTYFGGIQMPATVFVGADGEMVARHDGKLSEADLRAQLAELFDVETR